MYCYKTFSPFSIVSANQGCVNKINYFDKDLMMLVIFGLRGLKHELESRIALKCATEIYEKLQKVKYILTVSIGVTTGKVILSKTVSNK